jgi:hypothetical protein
MMHDRAHPIDAGSRIFGLAIPQPPMQPLGFIRNFGAGW